MIRSIQYKDLHTGAKSSYNISTYPNAHYEQYWIGRVLPISWPNCFVLYLSVVKTQYFAIYSCIALFFTGSFLFYLKNKLILILYTALMNRIRTSLNSCRETTNVWVLREFYNNIDVTPNFLLIFGKNFIIYLYNYIHKFICTF